jgi:hypothetical protein
MKNFKKYYASLNEDQENWPIKYEVLNPEKKSLSKYEYKDRRVIKMAHAIDQYNTRNNHSTEDVIWYYKKALDWLIVNGSHQFYFLIFSKKLNQGTISSWEPDSFNFDLSNKPSVLDHMVVTTYLPEGAKDPQKGSKPNKPTKLVLVEHSLQKKYMSKKTASYLSSLFDVPLNEADDSSSHPEKVYSYEKKFGKCLLTLFMVNGQVWDIGGATLVEVE